MHLIDHIPGFIDYLKRKRYAPATIKAYGQYLATFKAWLVQADLKDITPAQLSRAEIDAYEGYLVEGHVSPTGGPLKAGSQAAYLIGIRALLIYLLKTEVPCLAPDKIGLPKLPRDRKVSFLDAHEIERLLACPDTSRLEGLRDRAILEVLFSTGMRVGELADLKRGQVAGAIQDLADGEEPRVVETPVVGKGKKERTVFISPRAFDWLRRYLDARDDSDPAMFANTRSRTEKRNLSSRAIELMVTRIGVVAGLDKHVTPHTIRHSYATDLLVKGADLRSVQELLGHAHVATTEIYTHVTNRRLREVHERYHDVKE